MCYLPTPNSSIPSPSPVTNKRKKGFEERFSIDIEIVTEDTPNNFTETNRDKGTERYNATILEFFDKNLAIDIDNIDEIIKSFEEKTTEIDQNMKSEAKDTKPSLTKNVNAGVFEILEENFEIDIGNNFVMMKSDTKEATPSNFFTTPSMENDTAESVIELLEGNVITTLETNTVKYVPKNSDNHTTTTEHTSDSKTTLSNADREETSTTDTQDIIQQIIKLTNSFTTTTPTTTRTVLECQLDRDGRPRVQPCWVLG
jgi:hypothetical protein